MIRSTQAARSACLVILIAALPSNAAEPATRHAALADACRVLLQNAIRKPYGIAWQAVDAATDESVDKPSAQARVTVSFDPTATPAAALTLMESATLLDDPKLLKEADLAIRGIMAAQDKTGRIPARAVFWKRAGSDDPTQAEPDRAPTRASLAVMLAFAEQGAHPEILSELTSADRLNRNALRAARWLAGQQTQTGGWPVAVPPDAPSSKAERVLRLDTREYRDSSLALMFAGVALDDPLLKKGASNAMTQLKQLRISSAGHPGRGLWGTSYLPNGTPDETVVTDGADLDLRATRNAMLTLLSGHLILDEPGSLEVLDECVAVIERLRPTDGLWPRFPTRPQPKDGVFAPASETVQFDDVLAAIRQIHKLGREEAIIAQAAPFEPRQHVAAVLCGLLSEPFVAPTDAPDAPPSIFVSQPDQSHSSPAELAWRELMKVR